MRSVNLQIFGDNSCTLYSVICTLLLLLLLTKYREVDVATWARLHVNKKRVGTVDSAVQTVVDTTVV